MKFLKSILLVLVLVSCMAGYSAIIYLKKFDFNDENALDKWGNMILNGRVNYVLMKYGDEGYVKASSEKTCSALYYRIGFELKDYPRLTWRWKALKFPDKTQANTEEEKDDYAARVYVIFPFLNFSMSKFIEYIWAEDTPVDTIMNSPSGDNVKLIVARCGKIEGDQWASESRNLYEDYIKAFGKEPAMNAGAIAIMCDADSTKTSAESLFDDIAIGSQ